MHRMRIPHAVGAQRSRLAAVANAHLHGGAPISALGEGCVVHNEDSDRDLVASTLQLRIGARRRPSPLVSVGGGGRGLVLRTGWPAQAPAALLAGAELRIPRNAEAAKRAAQVALGLCVDGAPRFVALASACVDVGAVDDAVVGVCNLRTVLGEASDRDLVASTLQLRIGARRRPSPLVSVGGGGRGLVLRTGWPAQAPAALLAGAELRIPRNAEAAKRAAQVALGLCVDGAPRFVALASACVDVGAVDDAVVGRSQRLCSTHACAAEMGAVGGCRRCSSTMMKSPSSVALVPTPHACRRWRGRAALPTSLAWASDGTACFCFCSSRRCSGSSTMATLARKGTGTCTPCLRCSATAAAVHSVGRKFKRACPLRANHSCA